MGIGRSSFWFSLGTVFSRFSGLLRDSIVAGVYGASTAMDAFVVAFRIPNLLRDMLAEGALSSAFTKVYSSLSVTDPDRAKRMLHDSVIWTASLAIFVCASGSILSPWLVDLMTIIPRQGDSSAEWFRTNAQVMTAILFPYLFFPMVGAVLMGAMHQHGRFFITGLSPIGMNLGFIIGALLLSPLANVVLPPSIGSYVDRGIIGLCIGVLLGGAASLVFECWGMWQHGLRELKLRDFRWFFSDDVKRVLKIMIPAALAAGIGPINVAINTNFATSIGEGAVTWLNYAFRLLQLPIGIFGVAIASAALPAMTRAIAKAGNQIDQAAAREIQNAIELVLWLMVPCMCVLVANSQPLIQLLFQHMQFSADDATATAAALSAYSFGIIGYGVAKVLTAFYFAVERTKFALLVSVVSILVNLIGNSMLVHQYGHVGLAVTSSISLSLNAVILLSGLAGSRIAWDTSKILKTILMLVAGGIVMILGQQQVMAVLSTLPALGEMSHKLRAIILIAANGAMVCTVFAILAMLRLSIGPAELARLIKTRGRSR